MGRELSRRAFLRWSGVVAGTLIANPSGALGLLTPLPTIENPLTHYPNRDWERIYRDQYRFDSTFTFVCVPNDTHNCRSRAYVRNGIVTRIEQAYDVHTYQDLDGNQMTAAWNPRGCLKGYTVHRRVYGPYRVKAPMVRAGWKAWVDDGFPDPALPENRQRYFQRGQDRWVRTSWDEAATLIAAKLSELTGEPRFAEYFRHFHEGKSEVYMQRILDASVIAKGYTVEDILAGKYGTPGVALMLFRTYPRIPGWEQLNESVPFYNKTGRMAKTSLCTASLWRRHRSCRTSSSAPMPPFGR